MTRKKATHLPKTRRWQWDRLLPWKEWLQIYQMIKLFYFNAFVLFLKFNIFPVLQVRQMLFILQFGHAGEKESLKTTISWRVKSNGLKIFQILRYQCKVRKIFFPSISFHFSLLIFCLYLLDDYLWLLLIIYSYWWESFYLNGPSLSCIRLPAPSYTDGGWAGAVVLYLSIYFSMLFFILVFSFYWFVCIIFFH